MAVIDLRGSNPWERLMPSLVQMYAQGLMQRHFAQPKTSEPYTLSPGQARFRGKEKIAERDPKPAEPAYKEIGTKKTGS